MNQSTKAHRDVVVMKFGGTSVGDISRIKNVADILINFRKKNPKTGLVVVVSAMAGETNKLVALAKNCVAEPDSREMDVLLATGEQVTIALLSMALIEKGHKAKSLLGSQVRIETDDKHTNAHIAEIDSQILDKCIDDNCIPVVAGFQGIDRDGDVTTLGRGGSDITAVALAAALNAKVCYIYTDVPGVFSTDPRICKSARLLDRVAHEEMLEMASLGAKVLHTRSVYFAMHYGVPLVVLSTFAGDLEPGKNGTWIVDEEELMEKPVVTGITYRQDEARITIDGMPHGIDTLTLLFSRLADNDTFVDMITQTVAVDNKITLSFTVPDEVSNEALKIVRECLPSIGAKGASIERDIAKVSVVGVGMKYHTGVAAQMFKALAAEGIDIQMIATSEIKISVLVPRKYCEVAVRALHAQFVELAPVVTIEGEKAA